LESLWLFPINFLLMISLQEASSCCHQYYTVTGDGNSALHEEMFPFLAYNLKIGPWPAWHIERCATTSMMHWNSSGLTNQCAMPPSIPMSCSIIDLFTSLLFYIGKMRFSQHKWSYEKTESKYIFWYVVMYNNY
jgi:hypothetical protein